MYSRTICLVLACLVFILTGASPALARRAPRQQSAEALVSTYYQIINVGLRNGDFSALASVYALDATLTRSTPQGATVTIHGLNPIIAFYRTLYVAAPGTQFTRDRWYSLSPTIVLNYEHTTTTAAGAIARCSHLFVLRKGKIGQVFWVVYYAGRR